MALQRSNTISAIQVAITGTTEQQGNTFYVITLTKLYDPTWTKQIQKRYSNFEHLHTNLQKLGGIPNLPKLPDPYIIMTDGRKNDRKNELEKYLVFLVSSKETRHCEQVIRFLRLDEFCPELLYN